MSLQRCRARQGGLVDRDRPLRFRFDGRDYEGYHGDTLASALLANGVRLVGRSFKYHRPRGVFGIGVEEPSALVRLREGARAEPNLRATQVELYDGLSATSQNRWPTLALDVGELTNLLSPLFPAGFYYKTFMWPAKAWMLYEHFIRRAAGLGRVPEAADPDRYAKRYAHVDVLVVGAGASGLEAARAAARAGARVMLVEEGSRVGGSLLGRAERVDDRGAVEWADATVAELRDLSNVRVLLRATAFGYYDRNLVCIAERVADHVPEPGDFRPRQRIWWVRARQVVLATGAIERPVVFANNDRPGVMLASAVAGYARRYAVRCGERAVVFTNNDAAYDTVDALAGAGGQVAAVVDARAGGPGDAVRAHMAEAGVECLEGYAVVAARGREVQALEVAPLDPDARGRLIGSPRVIDCDLVAVSGGFNPTVHLHSQSRGRLRFDDEIAAFVPGESPQAERCAGAARGELDLQRCLDDGWKAGAAAARDAGHAARRRQRRPRAESRANAPSEPLWEVPLPQGRKGKRFVDLQNDVTADDVALAAREGYTSVEHLKRYTTLGMGTDQGRTSNVNGLAIIAALTGREIPEVGTTTFRPPFAPVPMGAIGGTEVGPGFAPLRRTPMHEWHAEAGATFVNVGLWQRPQYYLGAGEEMMDAINREGRAVRESVGIVDVSTLGKIEIRGRDAGEFLDRVYLNRFANLKVGRCRYGVMLREDGFIFDDGTTTRVAEGEYYMTTTTAHAAQVMSHLEFYAQTVWPELHVHLTSVTDQWAGLALAGPASREVLAAACDGADVSNEALPFMGYLEASVSGAPVRIFRLTFSGERAYEVHMPSGFGVHVWEALLAAGAPYGITPYGTEAMGMLRLEKGHVVGAELDGRTIPLDFGFDRMQKPDRDFVGRRSLEREAFAPGERRSLVGLVSQDGQGIARGSQLVADPRATPPVKMLGHVTSTVFSSNLGKEIALALLEDADAWQGRTLWAASPLTGRNVPVTVGGAVFVDPEGARPRG